MKNRTEQNEEISHIKAISYTAASLSYWTKFAFLVAPMSLQKELMISRVYPRRRNP